MPAGVLARCDVGNVRGRRQWRWNRILCVRYRHWRDQIWLKAGSRGRAGVTLRLRYANGRSRRHGESEGENKHSLIRVARVEACQSNVQCSGTLHEATQHRVVALGDAGQAIATSSQVWRARRRASSSTTLRAYMRRDGQLGKGAGGGGRVRRRSVGRVMRASTRATEASGAGARRGAQCKAG